MERRHTFHHLLKARAIKGLLLELTYCTIHPDVNFFILIANLLSKNRIIQKNLNIKLKQTRSSTYISSGAITDRPCTDMLIKE